MELSYSMGTLIKGKRCRTLIKGKRCLQKYFFLDVGRSFASLLLTKVVKILLRENFDLTNLFPTGTAERILQILPFTYALKFNPNYNGFFDSINVSSRSFKTCHV